jgi:hypothetical protein
MLTTFEWLEQTSLAIWVGESQWGYPIMISLHAVGMGVVVGILTMVNLRMLGAFEGMPYQSLRSLMKLAWWGFLVNLLSGSSLFASQATVFIHNVSFLIKIPAIFLALSLAGAAQSQLQNHAASWDSGVAVYRSARILAVCSMALWLTAIVAGRLTAYV